MFGNYTPNLGTTVALRFLDIYKKRFLPVENDSPPPPCQELAHRESSDYKVRNLKNGKKTPTI